MLAVVTAVSIASFGAVASAADTPTPKQLVARIAHAATKPGQVLHTTTQVTGTSGPGTIEVWIDLDRGLVRQQVGNTTDGGGWAVLVADGRQYVRFGSPSDKDGPARDCLLNGTTALLVAPCTLSHQYPRTVETGTRDGHSVLMLDSDRSATFKDRSSIATNRVWVDAKTSFPVASELKTRTVVGKQDVRQHVTTTEAHEFVSANSLPVDFFTPESVTAWSTAAHAASEQAAETRRQRLNRPGPVRGTGTLSDGSTWTVDERTDGIHPCFDITITSGLESGGGGCAGATSFDRESLPRNTTALRGHPTVVMVTAPRDTTAIEVTARGNRTEAVHLTNRDPIKSSAGFVAFVVELPARTHADVSAKVVN